MSSNEKGDVDGAAQSGPAEATGRVGQGAPEVAHWSARLWRWAKTYDWGTLVAVLLILSALVMAHDQMGIEKKRYDDRFGTLEKQEAEELIIEPVHVPPVAAPASSAALAAAVVAANDAAAAARQARADAKAAWGQQGDYLGGVLNPYLAFLSFAVLSLTFVLQSRQVHLSRLELQESRSDRAKSDQVLLRAAEAQERAARLAAFTAELSYVQDRLAELPSNGTGNRTQREERVVLQLQRDQIIGWIMQERPDMSYPEIRNESQEDGQAEE